MVHLRIAHCIEVRQRHAAAEKSDPRAPALLSLPTTTTPPPPRPANEWRLALDTFDAATDYKYLRPVAVFSVTRRFANVTRLEYAGVAIGRAESDPPGASSLVTLSSDRKETWLQSDICDAIRALPRLVYLSLEGMTKLSDASRRTIRALVASLTPPPVLVE